MRRAECRQRVAPEAGNPEERPCRYRREQALLNLLAFSSVVVGFYNLTHFDQRRQQNIDPLKTAVAQALGELVSSND